MYASSCDKKQFYYLGEKEKKGSIFFHNIWGRCFIVYGYKKMKNKKIILKIYYNKNNTYITLNMIQYDTIRWH